MTDRERILAAIRGEPVDRLPWIPRLEFWHRAKLRDGTLPRELRSLSLSEIAQQLGVGLYAVVPDFTDTRGELDMIDRTLGVFRLPRLVYTPILEGVDRRVTRSGRETIVEYHTPVGSLRTAFLYTDEMLEAGASMPWVTEHAIREPKDFEVVGYIFEHIRVEPNYAGYQEWCEEVGDRGLVLGYTLGTAGPIHHIMKEFMPMEQFFFALHDCPEAVDKLCQRMRHFYDQMLQVAADSPAEVILFGANYDDSITYPPFYRKYILPELRAYGDLLHSRGKFLATHTDGENRKLLPIYLESNFDVADSVCPHPMTSVTLEEFLDAFAGRVTIWGGIPSVLLCRESVTEQHFRNSIDDLVARHGKRTRFVLGVSDMVTADCDWDRMRYVTEKVTAIA